MPVTSDKSSPYAPPAVILDVIERHRSRGLPSPINQEVLSRAGISDSLISRTLQALQTLDLIDDAGNHTETLEGLRLAQEADYQNKLAEWLNTAYADVLTFVDPSRDDETKIRDAFRPYKPTGQQNRMVTLFVGLYSAAGMAPVKPKAKPPRDRTSKSGSTQRKVTQRQTQRHDVENKSPSSLPAPIAGLLSSLPADGKKWTQDNRDKFITTFSAVLDFCFPIEEEQSPGLTAEEKDDEQ